MSEKTEARTLVDKVCELQKKIDEHDRFLQDLLVMVCKRNPDHVAVQHGVDYYDGTLMSSVWGVVRDAIKEIVSLKDQNERLVQDLKESRGK